jgi:hypothetical protein
MPQEKQSNTQLGDGATSSSGDGAPVTLSASALATLALIISSNPVDELLTRDSRAFTALRAAAHVLALEARALDDRRGERFVVALRAAWPRIAPPVHHQADGKHDQLWDRLVSTCLEEFYDAPRLDPH